MPWARLEDTFWCSPKIIDAGNTAAGIFARAISYCAMHATDGYLPKAAAAALASADGQQTLEQHSLWIRVEAGMTFEVSHRRDSGNRPLEPAEVTIPGPGYFIPDFLQYHLTKRETAALREKKQAAGRSRAKAPAATPAQADAPAPAMSTPARVPTPTPINDDYVVVGDDGLDEAMKRLGWTAGQQKRARQEGDPAKVVAIIEHVEAVGSDNPAALAYSMLTSGQDPRSGGSPTIAAGATGTRSTPKAADAMALGRAWIAGQAWDDSYDLEAASEELQRIPRKAHADDYTAPQLATLLEAWHVEHERRTLASVVADVAEVGA